MTSSQDEFPVTAVKLARGALMIGSAVALAVFLTFFYYGWTGQRAYVGPLTFSLYYLCPLALAVILLAARRLPPNRQAQLVLAAVSALVSLYGLELFVASTYSPSDFAKPLMIRLTDASNRQQAAAALSTKWHTAIDPRTANEVIADFRTAGVDVLPIITPANHLLTAQADGTLKSVVSIAGHEVLPLAAVSGRRTILCNETGQWVDYQSDEHGFSNTPGVWQSDPLDIAALGDSFTHGYCVPPDQTFVALIRQRYPATLNLGIAGDGPLLMLAKLQEYVSPLKPKIVLWFYFENNDLADLQSERRSDLLKSYLTEGFTQRALRHQADVDQAIVKEIPRLRALEEGNRLRRQRGNLAGSLVSLAKLSALRKRLGLAGIDAAEQETLADYRTANMEVFRNVLREAQRRTEAWGGQLYFVYLPEWSRYTSYTSWGQSKRDEVLTSVRDLGIRIVDVDTAFRGTGDALSLFPFRAPGHYNENGHRVVADAVLKSISIRP